MKEAEYPNDNWFKKQISGLSSLPGFDKLTSEGMRQLIAALQHARSEQEALQVVNDFAQSGSFCPTPAEIRGAIYAKREAEEAEADPVETWNRACTRCNGMGFVIVRRGDITGARPCVCRQPKGAA